MKDKEFIGDVLVHKRQDGSEMTVSDLRDKLKVSVIASNLLIGRVCPTYEGLLKIN
jgi:hypothetical protein